jgi:aminopeptidase N
MSDREILPGDLKPAHYDLSIYNINVDDFTYEGTVVIDYAVKQSTDEIQLNYRGLKIKDAKVGYEHTKTEVSIDVKNILYDDKKEIVTFKLGQKIADGTSKLKFIVNFEQKIQDNMAGFYRSLYKDPTTGKDSVMLSTQFESTDARRAFPCADEPNLKATFDFKIAVPENWTALSNMPVVSSKSGDDGKKSGSAAHNVKWVTFERTPIMSTYLLAWACGEFEYIEAFTEKYYNGKKLPIRVYTTPGLKEQGRLALDSAVKILDYFSKVFDIDYVLPKCDLLAVHEFSHGAMENWGLITYRTTALLFDEATSDAAYKTRVVYVVAHELAHQWFGNLVTMDWWNELWLNEGFATWVGWFAVDYLYKEWDVFSRFIVEVQQNALALDALRTSHPIEVPVRNGHEIDQIFDHISYLKGASTIRMLSTQLGEQTFLKGVSNYLKKHAYSNARTVDLWNALSDVSGTDVAKAMATWTLKIGFPIVTVTEKDNGDVVLRQDRFLSTGDVQASENETVWTIPLSISDRKGDVLSEKETTIASLGKTQFKLNKNQTSLFRAAYTAERLQAISKLPSLSANDQVGLLADTYSTALAGLGSTSGLLTLVNSLKESTNNFVWTELNLRLGALRSIWALHSEAITGGLRKLSVDVITPILRKLGTSFTESDDYLTVQLRSQIILVAGGLAIPEIVSLSKELLSKWKAGDRRAVHPSLKRAVFRTAIENSTGAELDDTYNVVLEEAKNPSSVDGREASAFALGCVKEDKLIERSYSLLFDGTIPQQDVHTLLNQLCANPASRMKSWQFIKTNWDQIYKSFSSNMVIIDRLMRLTIANYSSKETYDDMVAFFKDKNTTGFDRSLAQSLDVVKGKYQWVDRSSSEVESWLKEHNYL